MRFTLPHIHLHLKTNELCSHISSHDEIINCCLLNINHTNYVEISSMKDGKNRDEINERLTGTSEQVDFSYSEESTTDIFYSSNKY